MASAMAAALQRKKVQAVDLMLTNIDQEDWDYFFPANIFQSPLRAKQPPNMLKLHEHVTRNQCFSCFYVCMFLLSLMVSPIRLDGY